jgi:hypothetical protein
MPYILPAWVSETCILAGWITAMLFAVVYTMKAEWWATWMGRNLFFFDIAVAMALTPGTLKYMFNVNIEGEFYQWFVVGDLILVTLLVAHRGYLLWKVQDGWNDWVLTLVTRSRDLYAQVRGRKRGDPSGGAGDAPVPDGAGAGRSSSP